MKIKIDAQSLARWHLFEWHRFLWSCLAQLPLMVAVMLLLLRTQIEDPKVHLPKSRTELLKFQPPPLAPEENATTIYEAILPEMEVKGLVQQSKGPGYFDQPEIIKKWEADKANFTALIEASHKRIEPLCNILDFRQPSSMPSHYSPRHYLLDVANTLLFDVRMKAHRGDHSGAACSLEAVERLAMQATALQLFNTADITVPIRGGAFQTAADILREERPLTPKVLAAYVATIPKAEQVIEHMRLVLEAEFAWELYNNDNVPPHPLLYTQERREIIERREYWRKLFANRDGFNRPSTLPLHFLMDNRKIYFEAADYRILVETAAAIIRFQQAKKRDPSSIAELTPQFLPTSPKRYAGSALSLSNSKGELQLFSAGMGIQGNSEMAICLPTVESTR